MATLKEDTTRELRNTLRERIKRGGSSGNWSNPINAIGTTITGVVSDLSQTFVEKTGGLTNGDINKVWRAKIFLDRLGGPVTGRTAGLPRDNSNTGKLYNPNTRPNQSPFVRPSLIPKINGINKEVWRNARFGKLEQKVVTVGRSLYFNQKYIHDFIKQHKRNEVIIFNLTPSDEGYQYIILQNRPPEVEFNGETSWASIKSFGRNTPMYHFTGAEDKLQFNISWYCNDPDRPWEVVQKCRLLEAWSKANGYTSSPPLLQIDWGGSGLFSNAYFILQSATYRLCNFRDGYMDRNKVPTLRDGKLYPMTATQELVFARVSTENLTYSSIYDKSKLSGINGIGFFKQENVKQLNSQDSNSLWQPA